MRSPATPSAEPSQHVHAARHLTRLARIVAVVARRRLQRRRRVLDGPRHRTGVVDALVGAKPDPEMRHQPERRLDGRRAAERRRDTDRAALVAAKGDVHLARRYRRARPRRRAARDVLGVVRVERSAVVADPPPVPKPPLSPFITFLPMIVPPACSTRVTIVASKSGMKPSSANVPKLIGMPATATWSL